MKKLYTGPFGPMARQIWVNKIKQRMDQDRASSFLFILPTQNLLKEVRQYLLEELEGIPNLHLLSFDDIALKIMEHAIPGSQSFTNYEFFRLHDDLIDQVLEEFGLNDIQAQLEQSGVKNAFIHMMGELKRSGFTVEQAMDMVNDPHGIPKFKAISRLFILSGQKMEQLSRWNQTTYLTTESRLEKAIAFIEKGDLLPAWLQQIDTVWVDQFLDFTPLQFKLLRQLVCLPSIQQVGIYVPYQKERYDHHIREGNGYREGLHSYLEKMLQRIHHEWGFERVDLTGKYGDMVSSLSKDWCTEIPFEKVKEPHADLWRLGGVLFSSKRSILPMPERMEMIPCASEKKEVEMVFKLMKQSRLRNPLLKPRDFAIMVRDGDTYKSYLLELAKEENIPIQLNRECTLREVPLIQQVQSLLWLKESNWNRDLLMKLADGSSIQWENQPSQRLIRWMKSKGILEGEANWIGALRKDMESTMKLQAEAGDDSDRERWREEEKHLRNHIHWFQELNQRVSHSRGSTVEGHIQQLSSLITSLQLEKVILNQPRCPSDQKMNWLKRDWQALQLLIESLEEMRASAKLLDELQRELPYSEFLAEWQQLWLDQTVVIEKGDPEGMVCLDPSSARGLQFKEVYVLGCNEGSFPLKQREHWLLGDTERSLIKEMSHLSTSHYHYEKELLFFHMSIQAALEKLTFTFISPKSNESALVSAYLETVLKCYPEEWASEQENKWRFAESKGFFAPDTSWISSKREYGFWLAAKGRADAHRLYHLFRKDWLPANHEHILEGIHLDYSRKFGAFSKWDGYLQHPKEDRMRSEENQQLRDELELLYSDDHCYSVSQINEYMSSPLTFFFKRILRVHPLDTFEQDVSPVDKGNILHEVLRRFFTQHRGEVLAGDQLQAYQEELSRYLREEANLFARGTIYEHSAIWMLEVEKLAADLNIWLKMELELGEKARAKGGALVPQYLELSFGLPMREGDHRDERSDEQPIQIDLGEDKIWLYGIIDRIDMDEQGHFVIYDYKSSLGRYMNYWKLSDGYTYQIPLYLYSMKKWLMKQKDQEIRMVGGGYYSLKPSDTTKKGLWNEALKQLIAVGSKGIEDIEERITEHLKDIQTGLRKLKAGHFYLMSKHFTNPYFADLAVYRHESIYLRDKEIRSEGENQHDSNHPGES